MYRLVLMSGFTRPGGELSYTVRPNKKETRFISEISSLPRKI